MSKEYIIKDDVYLTLLKYFNGDIIYLNAEILKDLKKGIFKGEPVREIDKSVLKVFVTILKLKKQKPEVYANMKWIYPEWDEKEKNEKLKKYFPEDYEDEGEEEKDVFLIEQLTDKNNVNVEELKPSVDTPDPED